MILVPTAEQRYFTAALRGLFAEHRASPWKALAGTGAFGLALDPDHGGQGATLYDLGLLFAEAGRVLCPALVYSTLVSGLAVQRLAGPGQAERLLPALARGELAATTAMWNPADAGDVQPALEAERIVGGWSITGTLPFVAGAQDADLVLVTARDSGAFTGPARTLAFLVEPGAPGWHAEPVRPMGGGPTATVTLTGCEAGDDRVLGPGGVDDGDLTWIAQTAVALQCMEMAGGAAAVLDRTVEYVKGREQFGRPIASFQAAQHHVANMRMAVDGARLAASSAVWWLGREGKPATRAVAIAKMKCSEAYKEVTLTAHQLHGGMGYVRDTGLHLWSERAKATEILGGTADIAAGWLQRELGLVR